LREWLDYAATRVPQMQEENLSGKDNWCSKAIKSLNWLTYSAPVSPIGVKWSLSR
jgi:hypothetical protein